MKYILTIILIVGLLACTKSESSTEESSILGNSGRNVNWYQSGMHYKTLTYCGETMNTINVTLDSLQVLKLQKELESAK